MGNAVVGVSQQAGWLSTALPERSNRNKPVGQRTTKDDVYALQHNKFLSDF
jgi:hypothetical protein